MIKSINIFLLFSYFSSLNLKYLKLTKMDITRFAKSSLKYRGGILSAFYLCFKSVVANRYSEHRFISVVTIVLTLF